MGMQQFVAGNNNGNNNGNNAGIGNTGTPTNGNGNGTPVNGAGNGTPTNGSGNNGQGNGNMPMDGAFMPPTGAQDAMAYLINYNQKYENSDPIKYRDGESFQMMSILIGKNKPNCLLIGEAGTGKTAIVEDFARRLANGDKSVPEALEGMTVYELPLSNIIAGSGIVGETERKLKSVVEFVSDPNAHAILFIDEIHQLYSGNPEYQQMAQILKPALSRGCIKCIGATTSQEASKLTADPAFNRRFSKVQVSEFTQDQTVDILKGVAKGLSKHYENRIVVPEDLLPTVVSLADEYRPAGTHRPDNAITLLDRAMGEAITHHRKIENAVKGNSAQLAALNQSRVMALNEHQVEDTASGLMTGQAKTPKFNEERLKNALQNVKGQDKPIAEMIKTIKDSQCPLFPHERPVSFLLAGTSGVGKTETAKCIAKELTGLKPIVLNMTEYRDGTALNRIIGSSAGYVGYNDNNELPFDALEGNPFQVILLDEFEKADRGVMRLFMNVLEDGVMTTSKGKVIDFSRAIIIATTNATCTERKEAVVGFGAGKTTDEEATVEELSRYFDVELLNRFTKILTYNRINYDTYKEILMNLYANEVARIKATRPKVKLADNLSAEEASKLADASYQADFGARPARETVKQFIIDQTM